MKSFRLSTDAAADIREIRNYIAEDSIDAARRFRLKLLAACRQLGTNPGLGHKRADLAGDRPLLFWPAGNYLIIYRPQGTHIDIIAVAHGGRDIPLLLERRGV